MALFQDLNAAGITILLVTHDPDIARYATRMVEVRDGRIIKDEAVVDRHVAANDLLKMGAVLTAEEDDA